mgnify:CR=1 FL=1
MEIIERTRTVAAGADEVWAVLSDFGAISGWAANVDHSCLLTDQSTGVGAVRRIQTGRTTLRETVETWEPPTTLGYRISGLPPVVRSVTNTWHVAAAGNRTEIVLRTEIDAGHRPPGRLVAKVVGSRLSSASDLLLDGLQRAVEGGRDE